ncbi:prolyl aminopeptidase [Mycoplasma buteonis]|uniref:prolyl aminopeptidase n=1 Tax=Mycoplasma buteonis TaxID=171280 RepID=UPI00055CBD29|nr:prolyl aminopeptidase [Mycoplasma buteonis]
MSKLYNEIEPYLTGHLPVSDLHQIYYEVSGNPDGIPLLFIHGGPGGSTSAKCRQLFNPSKYKIILFDQRGAGKSLPAYETKDNNTWELINDIEKLRKHLNVDKFVIFGGSWGTTLGLSYAINHPKHVSHLVLRGVFLTRQEDIDFLYEKGADAFYPEYFKPYKEFVKDVPKDTLLEKYYHVFNSGEYSDDFIKRAAYLFANWESCLVSVHHQKLFDDEHSNLSISKLETHYFHHKSFFPTDNYILENAYKIKDIPTFIVHGRQDMDTRPIGAFLLKEQLNNCELNVMDVAGHTMWDENNLNKLIEIFDNLK